MSNGPCSQKDEPRPLQLPPALCETIPEREAFQEDTVRGLEILRNLIFAVAEPSSIKIPTLSIRLVRQM